MKQVLCSFMGLPRWVRLWLPVRFGTNLASLAYLDTQAGRYIAVAFAFICAFNMPMMAIQRGFTRLLAIPHFAWLPLVVFLYDQLWGADPMQKGPVRTYVFLVIAFNTISLVLDIVGAAKWVGGRPKVLGLNAR